MHLSRRGPEVRRCAAQQAHRSEFHSVTTRTSVHQCTCMHEVHSGRMVYRRPVWHRLHDFPLNVEAFVLKHVNLVCTGRVTVARCTLAQCGKQSYKSPLYAEMLQSQGATLHKAAGKLRKVPLSAEICVHTHVCVGYPTA